jgi:predicted esterase YcpF (UPF0227 family)
LTIYIHGFGSHGYGSKANILREYYKSIDRPFIAPSLSFIPALAIGTLEELVQSYEEVNLIGSSLGGFYALYLASKYNLKTVLINPSIYPYETLKKHVGKAPSFYDDGFFMWDSSYLEMLKKYDFKSLNQEDILLMLQSADETLDYKEALERLPDSKQIVEQGGSHGFDGFERYVEDIAEFFKDI